MILSEINKNDIIKNFETHKNFNNQIQESLKYLDGHDKFNLMNIMLYYNIVFDCGCSMIHDNLVYCDMANCSIASMHESYKAHPLPIFQYLENRIIKNQNYVRTIKKLA